MLCKDPKKHKRRGWCFKQCCLTNNKHKHKDKMFSKTEPGVWKTPQRRQIHCKFLTDLWLSQMQQSYHFQVLFTFNPSVNEMKGLDKENWSDIQSGMCQAGEDCFMRVCRSEVDLSPEETHCTSTTSSQLWRSEQRACRHDFELITWSKLRQDPRVQSRGSDLHLRALCPRNTVHRFAFLAYWIVLET